MSIRDEINAQVTKEGLVEYVPLPPISVYRPVFLTPDVSSQIYGPPNPDSDEAIEMSYVRADLDNFVGEGLVHMAFGRGPKSANFRRLEVTKRKRPKVWEMRTLEPSPGHRLYGFFAHQDVFVGVDLVPRDLVDFDEDISRANATWVNLFGSYEPVTSENINDYISKRVVRLRGT
jgi:hypothetical protein